MTHPSEDTLQAYLDGELAPAEEANVRKHMADCAACRISFERLREFAEVFSAAIATLDAAEPAHWDDWESTGLGSGGPKMGTPVATRRHDSRRRDRSHLRVVPGSAGSAPDRGEAVRRRAWRIGPVLRWAAGITLVAVGAGSAAVIAFPGLRLTDARPETAGATTDAVLAPQEDGLASAAVAVRPLDDDIRVVVANASAGTKLYLEVADVADAVVQVRTGGEPRFEARDGFVRADLGGVAGEVHVRLPRALGRGTIQTEDVVVARVIEGEVTPPEASSAEGLTLPARH